jgi:hypothetical protein
MPVTVATSSTQRFTAPPNRLNSTNPLYACTRYNGYVSAPARANQGRPNRRVTRSAMSVARIKMTVMTAAIT